MKVLSYLFILVFTSSLYAQDANEKYESCLSVVESYSQLEMVSFGAEEVNSACSKINNSGSLNCISQNVNQGILLNDPIDLFSIITKCARNSRYRVDSFGTRG